jgi:YegS/Rv2252/BmrU family lipid kinase
MNFRKLFLIANPRAGRKSAKRLLESFKPQLERTGAVVEVHFTEKVGGATSVVERLPLSEKSAVIVIGGDGTVHETINGLMQRASIADVPLGIIPAGSGNSMMWHLDCLDPQLALSRILAGQVSQIDLCEVRLPQSTCYSMNIVGWGSVVDINQNAESIRWFGTSRYTLAALWEILVAKRRNAKLTWDGGSLDGEFFFAIGCNTRFTGKGMRLAPNADLQDGKVDLVIVKQASRFQLLKLLLNVFDGSHVNHPSIEIHQVTRFSIESASESPFNIDGEIKGASPVHVRVLPKALGLFV